LYLFIRWEKRAETEIGDGRKEEVETQEKICGRACFFCSLLCIIPLKMYASRGENYSTNDMGEVVGRSCPRVGGRRPTGAALLPLISSFEKGERDDSDYSSVH
jgi:hypothetical protein